MNKNLLLISYYFFPSNSVGAKRFIYLSKYFEEMGNRIFILTVKEKYYNNFDMSLTPGGKIFRSAMLIPYPIKKNNIIKKILNRIWETMAPVDTFIGHVLPSLFKGLKIVKDFKVDTIVVTGPPFSTFIVGYCLAKLKNLRLVIDYRDPWVFYQQSKSKFHRAVNYYLEKKIINYSRVVVFNTEYAKNGYLNKYFKLNLQNKSIVISNAFELNNISDPIHLETNKKVIVYAGNFYGERRLKYLIKPILRLIDEKRFNKDNLAIHVFGEIQEDDLQILKESNLDELTVQHKYESYERIIRYLMAADVLYLPQGEDVKYSIAYKFYDYLSVKKPILAIIPQKCAVADIMNELDCGEIAVINDDDSVYNSLKKLLVEEKKYTFSGYEKYTWENITKKYLKLV